MSLQKPKMPGLLPAIFAAAFVAIVWLITAFAGLNASNEVRGTFGDMFGAANAAFSGLAFVGVVYAIFLQRHEVQLTKDDLQNTKKILDDQVQHIETQNRNGQIQFFESTFFKLLEEYRSIVSDLDIEGRKTHSGKDVFPIFLSRIKSKLTIKNTKTLGWELPKNIDLNTFQSKYEEFYSENRDNLGHYFRFIYNIIKFIDASDLENKKFYTNILRSQFSDAESTVLLMNCVSKYGENKFKPYAEKYRLLKFYHEKDPLAIQLTRYISESAIRQIDP